MLHVLKDALYHASHPTSQDSWVREGKELMEMIDVAPVHCLSMQ
jgi:hypothetical protein